MTVLFYFYLMSKIYKAYWFSIGLFLLVVISSCSTDDEPTPEVNSTLAEYEELASFSAEQLKLIAAFSGFAEYIDMVEYGFTLYEITYFTEFKGERVLASGVVTVPQGSEQFPMLLGGHGTITDNQKAPSNLNFDQNNASGFELFASFGFISVIPDYLGFGASTDLVHPYFDYQSSAQASVDMISATQEFLEEQEISFATELFLTGYSQGGYVAMATMKYLAENPQTLDDFTTVATAVGAGGYNIRQGMELIFNEDTYPVPANLAFLVYAYQQTNNWDRPLTDFFQEPFASQIPSLFDGSNSTGTINSRLSVNLNELFQPSFIASMRDGTETEFLASLENNSVHDWSPETPVRLYHEVKDEVVPIQTSERTFQIMQQNGAAEVSYFPFDEAASHREGAQPMYVQTIPWFISLRSFD